MTRTFPMQQVRLAAPIAILGFAIVSLLATSAAFLYVMLGSREVVVGAERVVVDGTIYSTEVPRAAIDASGVKIIDLDRTPELELRGRQNAFGLPGLREGWYELTGGNKAFVMVTDMSRVVAIPTTAGYWILVSATDPERLVKELSAPPGST